MTKKWYASKTLWLNVIGILAIIFGPDIISPEIEATILSILNFVMRLITKEGLKA